MAGGVNDAGLVVAPAEGVAFFQQVVDAGDFGSGDAEERGLHFHGLIERQILLMHEDRGAGDPMQFAESADVVDVRMSADDGFYGELVAARVNP